jgi:non-ribosomal peptide synthetase component F
VRRLGCVAQLRVLQRLPAMRSLCSQLVAVQQRWQAVGGEGDKAAAEEAGGAGGGVEVQVGDFTRSGLARTRRHQQWAAAHSSSAAATTLLALATRSQAERAARLEAREERVGAILEEQALRALAAEAAEAARREQQQTLWMQVRHPLHVDAGETPTPRGCR